MQIIHFVVKIEFGFPFFTIWHKKRQGNIGRITGTDVQKMLTDTPAVAFSRTTGEVFVHLFQKLNPLKSFSSCAIFRFSNGK